MWEFFLEYGYDGENIFIIIGFVLCVLEDRNLELGRDFIIKFLEVVDEYILIFVRDFDKFFFFFIEDNFFILGCGIVVMGRVERGMIKIGDEVEVVGYGLKVKMIVIGNVRLLVFNVVNLVYVVLEFSLCWRILYWVVVVE